MTACPTTRRTASIRQSTTRTSRRRSILVEGFAFAIPTALVALDRADGLAVCDSLNRALGAVSTAPHGPRLPHAACAPAPAA